MRYEKLFSKGMIGSCELKNRIIMSPFNKNYCNLDGTVGRRLIDYMVERAKGGTGLLMVGATAVSPEGKGHFNQQALFTDEVVPSFRKLTDAVHAGGAKIAVQINHRGRQTSSKFSCLKPVAPSPVPGVSLGKFEQENPIELSVEQIKRIIGDFAAAAGRAKKAGFDIIEIHGAHGYLINQFTSPYSNKRTDEYGGTTAKRERFAMEIISAVRKAVGDDFPLVYRISADELVDGGLAIQETASFAKRLEEAGIDLIDVSATRDASSFLCISPMDVPLGPFIPYSDVIKAAVSIPVSAVCRINDPNQAEDILANQQADFICMARALHADPFFPEKAMNGRDEDIFACLGCLQGCTDNLGNELPIECTANPRAGRERLLVPAPAAVKKKILVVGGGPAGMEAARVSAGRGHQVVLYEKEKELGGQLRYLSRLPYNDDFGEMVRYLSLQIKKQGVRIELATEATVPLIREEAPDVVIAATGSRPLLGDIPGRDQTHVVSYLDLMDRTSFSEKKVVVVGGDVKGCQVCEFLSERGVEVAIVEPKSHLAMDGGKRHKIFTLRRIDENPNIEVYTNTSIDRISDHSVIIVKGAERQTLNDIDLVVMVVGSAADTALADELVTDNAVPEIHYVGDCFSPRKALHAMLDAAEVTYRL